MANESVDTPEAKLLGHALANLRQRVRAADGSKLSQQGAGERFGISGEGWRKYEAGLAKSIFAPDTQTRLAAALGATRDELLAERARLSGEDLPAQPRATPAERASWAQARTPDLTLLPIRDTVQAGAWLAADDTGQTGHGAHPVARDPRYPQAHQWLSQVRGDSVNLLNIVEGDLVHCVDAIDVGYYPRTGDVVEVERLRFGGQERELTLKQVEVTDGAVLLWPRSSNPRWRAPLELREGMGDLEEFEVRIRALIVASVRRF